jgi:hypothetical protein
VPDQSTLPTPLPPLTADLWEHGTPEQLAPYTTACGHDPRCRSNPRHLTTRAARQLYDNWHRLDEEKAALEREARGEPALP